MKSDDQCPLCSRAEPVFYCEDKKRSYFQCSHCDLVFVPKSFHLSPEQEKSEYDLHENSVEDPGYRKFLSRAYDPLSDLLECPSKGLDFGCGPAPALAAMLQSEGHAMSLYDLYYFPEEEALRESYDFITATEVVEHLAQPGSLLENLWSVLKPGGLLLIMTKKVIDKEAFGRWHYKNDPTHIAFFSDRSFRYLEELWSAGIVYSAKDVTIFRKPA